MDTLEEQTVWMGFAASTGAFEICHLFRGADA